MRNRNYKMIKVDGKTIPEHRYIMEQYLGRKLTEDEVVHHINHIQNDNRIENLQVINRIEHAKLTAKENSSNLKKVACVSGSLMVRMSNEFRELSIKEGDMVEVNIVDNAIIIKKVNSAE